MSDYFSASMLLLSLQRALLGEVHPQLRQASIEADSKQNIVRLRFEYDGSPSIEVRNSCSCVATEVIANFPAFWDLDEQHIDNPEPGKLAPLAQIAYLRAEPQHAV